MHRDKNGLAPQPHALRVRACRFFAPKVHSRKAQGKLAQRAPPWDRMPLTQCTLKACGRTICRAPSVGEMGVWVFAAKVHRRNEGINSELRLISLNQGDRGHHLDSESSCNKVNRTLAEVAELADALASGASPRKGVQVQVLSSASRPRPRATLAARACPGLSCRTLSACIAPSHSRPRATLSARACPELSCRTLSACIAPSHSRPRATLAAQACPGLSCRTLSACY